LIWLLPAVMVMFVIAKPFFTLWAGEEFGRESTLPLRLLLIGLLFSVVSYIPFGAILAAGRSEVFAKLYWVELPIYAVAAGVLVYYFQIAGAAIAYSIRVFLDSVAIIVFSKRIAHADYQFGSQIRNLFGGASILIPPVLFAGLYDNSSLWLLPIVALSLIAYLILIWKAVLTREEVGWVLIRLRSFNPGL